MILESLLTLVETLRKHVDDHGDALRQSEALTRYVLIDPLLRELGWNTEDPDMVRPEFRVKNASDLFEFVDYALHNNGKPVMMLEAKKLDTNLRDAVGQGIQYCIEEGTKYFSVTDGRRWEIYETYKPVPRDDKKIISFDLKDPVAEVCLKALALWRPSVISGHVQVGQTPIVGLTDEPPSTATAQPIHGTTIQEPSSVIDGQGWQPLSELNPQGRSKPTEISFPDRSTVRITAWKHIMVKSVHWLIDNNILNTSNTPIPTPGGQSCLVSTTGKELTSRSEKKGAFYFQVHNNAKNIVLQVRQIIQHVGQDPAQFKVR